ncbi:Transposase InsO and inactivated derivatives [Bifidobacterium longum]|nr:Transposase InsO and inactivated derivatives [Bifidobacterium longum]
MVACIDEFEDRFRVGPICRVLAASLDCGFITPRGYRMFRSRPVSRMAARHEALARDILEIHADFFMAVYGYRKTRAQLLARGWDPAGIGRDQVMNVMRELGIRGVRRGGTPVTARPAKGTGGGPGLVERRFEAEAPNRLHVADITYVRMANGSFGYTAFVTDVFARRIVGWACATTMDTRELPLQALEQAISWAASHGGTDGLVHHSDHGAQYISLVYTTRVGEFGMLPSTGTVGDSYDNAMAESVNGAYKTELVWRRKPFQDEGPGIGDVPVGLVAGTRSVCTSPWATGHRNGPKPSIMQTKRRKPPHYKGGTKIRPYQPTWRPNDTRAR